MIVLLDEDVPRALGFRLQGHTVETVTSQGWLGVKNGSLLKLIEQSSFEVFITADKNMSYQQDFGKYPFAVLILSTNHWPTVRKNTQAVRDAVNAAMPGMTALVDCGFFESSKRRKHADVSGAASPKE